MILSNLSRLASRKRVTVSAFIIGALITSASIVGLAQQTSANAASNETYVGQQVITINKTKVTGKFYACKISQGSGNYKVRIRATHNAGAILTQNNYRLNVGSNLGSTTSAYTYVNKYSPLTSVVSNGKAKSNITFSTYLGKGSSAGYTKTSGTTLRSFTVSSIRTC